MVELRKEDLLTACNSGPLSTDQKRKTAFKKYFNYVEPVPLLLGTDDKGRESFAQYVPVQETLATLFKSKSIQEQYAATRSQPSSEGLFQDIKDGKGAQCNPLFKMEPSSLGLILYQDAFEVVNPLGSSKKKHKIVAVYLTLTDILPHNRSTTDQMQLVLLCNEQAFKYFGIDKVFEPLIKDLKALEETGVVIGDGQIVKGRLCAISGDNLGSHSIGGFVENFSKSHYFCRYCDLDRTTFQNSPLLCGNTRTEQSYRNHLQELGTSGRNSEVGIKSDSPFNQLSFFHVCQPGLPPCLGHDLFEGIVSSDLALFIGYLVKNKHFSYLHLNRCIDQFKYQGSDAHDKPADVSPGSNKLTGHAAQNWCLLRLLPLLVGDRIKNPCDDAVWQLLLQLREIVELICAPAITTDQVAYLKILIEDYIYFRRQLFPDQSLKPKHHYLLHYPQLITEFGPLIRLWTLRFESKHSFFKRCARKLHNFKNICKTVAERHQLFQAYLSAGEMFQPSVLFDKGTAFYVNDYSDKIRKAVVGLNLEFIDTVASHVVTVKGTSYKKGMYILLGKTEEELEVGKIELVIVHHGSVFFISEKYLFVKLSDIGVYCVLGTAQEEFVCVRHEDLLDYYPLPAYEMCGMPIISLHHSFAETY
nr:uncharacterized protein LOC111839475 [Paramormyrops kingsleyae]XP_023659191.1 uncharacterized protein LOC111839475 [Paramormyrops kingsleyae]